MFILLDFASRTFLLLTQIIHLIGDLRYRQFTNRAATAGDE
ncbi:hypothetical protein HNQ92_002038 [Rhabdobacter roseus]|uniref:Uncharacterized protein n=1 Tax=Rhabdobacter roseus TaxID=1655419 RepID=A0A840TQU8_9BACT|nr:hypothetical protein [Rhabdobacter roseus]